MSIPTISISTMSVPASRFAQIGRCYPSEAFEPLYQVSLAARADRRGRSGSWDGSRAKVWRGSGEHIAPSSRLTA